VGTKEGDALAEALLAAVREALASGDKPEHKPKKGPGREVTKERREREAKLQAWRREEAKRRDVDEQAVLPGHCLKDIAALPGDADAAALASVAGLGALRVERDGAAILAALAKRGST
jgi:ribonuclease D